MGHKYLADDEFCINLNKLRLVSIADNIPMHDDPSHTITLIYEDLKESITISYINKDKRDSMYSWIIYGISATEILLKTKEES